MQLSYHTYSVRDIQSGERFRVDIRKFVAGYARWDNPEFKNSFNRGGEFVFLLPYVDDIYLFVQAKDREIIKRIERSTLSVSEIRDKLDANESIGFASYVRLSGDYIAICSTVQAPRITAFADYVCMLFSKLNMGLSLEINPMTYSLPKDDAVKLSHVGAFSMKVTSGNKIYHSLSESLGGSGRPDFDIGSIEIIVRPAATRKNNRSTMLAALELADGDGLESFDVRAKIDAADKMSDIFIVGAGGIRDPISTTDEKKIAEQMIEAARSNKVLGERLNEFRKNAEFTYVADPSDLDLAWPPASCGALDAGNNAF